MVHVANRIRELENCGGEGLPIEELVSSGQPAVLRGVAKDWGLVRAGLSSDSQAMSYLRSFYNGKPVQYSFGEPRIDGRPFYTEDFTELNCIVKRERLDDVLTQIESHLSDARPPTYYVASLPIDSCLPGLRAENDFVFKSQGIDAPHARRAGRECRRFQ
jgi:hypothetical protein